MEPNEEGGDEKLGERSLVPGRGTPPVAKEKKQGWVFCPEQPGRPGRGKKLLLAM